MTQTAAVPESTGIKLPSDLGIENASQLYGEMLAHVDDARPVVLDAADVSRIHAAALQLFCMFCQDRRNAGYETRWQAPSETLKSAAALLGITTLLQLAKEKA